MPSLYLVVVLVLLNPIQIFGQNSMQLEWASPGQVRTPSAFQREIRYVPGSLDVNSDGINEVVGRRFINGELTFYIIDGNDPSRRWLLDDWSGPHVQSARLAGFYDVADDDIKEIVVVAEAATVVFKYDEISLDWSIWDSLGPYTNIRNYDTDEKYEIRTYDPVNEQIQIFGEAFNPGVRPDSSIDTRSFTSTCNDLVIEWVSPENTTWPSSSSGLLPDNRFDYDRDGIDDILGVFNDTMLVFGLANQQILIREALPPIFQVSAGGESPAVMGAIDFCDDPGSPYTLMGKRPAGGQPALHRIDSLTIMRHFVNENRFLSVASVFTDQGSDPSNWRLRAVSDWDHDGLAELVMQNNVTRRLAIIGVGDDNGFSAPSNFDFTPSTSSGNSTLDLQLKWESENALNISWAAAANYQRNAFDLNNDDLPELVAWQEAADDSTAIGIRVFDIVNQQGLWMFNFPAGDLGDTLRRFHGFFDVDGDAEKEVYLGRRSVVTQDGTPHQPFGTGFSIFAIFDMDNDGVVDVVGRSESGTIQIWGISSPSSVLSPAINLGFEAQLFPNPSSAEMAHIQLATEVAGAYSLSVFNLQGQQLSQRDLGYQSAGNLGGFSLQSLFNLPPATYLLRIEGPQGIQPLVWVKR